MIQVSDISEKVLERLRVKAYLVVGSPLGDMLLGSAG
jgi:hypothetical protein